MDFEEVVVGFESKGKERRRKSFEGEQEDLGSSGFYLESHEGLVSFNEKGRTEDCLVSNGTQHWKKEKQLRG